MAIYMILLLLLAYLQSTLAISFDPDASRSSVVDLLSTATLTDLLSTSSATATTMQTFLSLPTTAIEASPTSTSSSNIFNNILVNHDADSLAQLPPKPWSEDDSALSKSSLIGIVIAVLVIIPVTAVVAVFYAKRWRKSQEAELVALQVRREGQRAPVAGGGIVA